MSKAYYSEWEPYAAQWLRNLIAAGLIADGDVDTRDIRDVKPAELAGYTQCHFFAGIGGWSYALRLAGWPDNRPVWTGSCPCQPFSSAGEQRAFEDPRHLWPDWYRLIRARLPAAIFGEQVAHVPAWLALVRSNLATLDYAVGALPIEAASAGARQLRDRFWFGAIANGQGQLVRAVHAEMAAAQKAAAGADVSRQSQRERCGTQAGPAGRQARAAIACRDRGFEHWRNEPGMGRLVHGVSARVGGIKAFGNAIVPQAAARFIEPFRELCLG